MPRVIMSDNANTFDKAAKTFKNIFLDLVVHKYLPTSGLSGNPYRTVLPGKGVTGSDKSEQIKTH